MTTFPPPLRGEGDPSERIRVAPSAYYPPQKPASDTPWAILVVVVFAAVIIGFVMLVVALFWAVFHVLTVASKAVARILWGWRR